MSEEQLKVVVKCGSLSSERAVDGIMAVLREHDMPLTDFSLGGQPMDLPAALSQLTRSRPKAFDLVGQGFRFSYGSLPNVSLDFLEVVARANASVTWDAWAKRFVTTPQFAMAWIVDCYYDYWQNAEDPLQYVAVGRPYTHLPMKSNGLPPPLQQKIIDTSANPGRWLFRDGYIEAVGAVMWLGAPFWTLTGADQEQVERASWVRVSHPAPLVTRIQAADHCFRTPGGHTGRLQSALRLMLFPGSGEGARQPG